MLISDEFPAVWPPRRLALLIGRLSDSFEQSPVGQARRKAFGLERRSAQDDAVTCRLLKAGRGMALFFKLRYGVVTMWR